MPNDTDNTEIDCCKNKYDELNQPSTLLYRQIKQKEENKSCCKPHVTKPASTRINVRKGLTNRERLRQRGLMYAQNQNGYKTNYEIKRNHNSELCDCPKTTVRPSNSKKLTDRNKFDKGYHTQGAVDAGTRMENLN